MNGRWPLTNEDVRQKFGLDPTHVVRQEQRPFQGQTRLHMVFDLTAEDEPALLNKLPSGRNGPNGQLFLQESAAPELSSLLLLYLVAYFLGMLVRYYPTTWMSLMSRATGDFSYPLLKAAVGQIEERFPALLVSEFQDYLRPLG